MRRDISFHRFDGTITIILESARKKVSIQHADFFCFFHTFLQSFLFYRSAESATGLSKKFDGGVLNSVKRQSERIETDEEQHLLKTSYDTEENSSTEPKEATESSSPQPSSDESDCSFEESSRPTVLFPNTTVFFCDFVGE